MKTFRSDRQGNESADGDFFAVELESLAEKRKLRGNGPLPTFPFVVVFDQNGRLCRLPCANTSPLSADESAFLNSLRQLALEPVAEVEEIEETS